MLSRFVPKREVTPYHVACLDIETDENGACIGIAFAWIDADLIRHVDTFDGWSEWWNFYQTIVKKNPYVRRIYAHNGASFDWLSFLDWSHDNDLLDKVNYIFSGGMGIGCDVKLGKISIKLRDSLRLLPASLKKLSQTFDVEHKKLDIDVLPAVLKRNNPVLFWQYARNDVLALQEIIFSFWSLIYAKIGNIGELPMTLASLSMKLWRMTLSDSMMVSWNKELKEFERRAYSGGRTECYNVTEASVEIYDANSEYPAVMLNGIYPLSYKGGWTTTYEGEHGLYEVDYQQTNTFYKPVLRDEKTQTFTYTGNGVYTKPELDELLLVGGNITVKQGYIYEEIGNPFKEFITDWWKTRLDAQARNDTAFSFVCKILMNSLYGKFGQREEGYTLKLLSSTEQEKLIEQDTPCYIVGDYTMVWESRHSEHTFVGIAAYITSQARLWLYRQMRTAQDAGCTLYATDTDSVHISPTPVIATGNNLGEWKKEYAGNAVYLGKKLYALADETIKSKGISKTCVPMLSYEVFRSLASGDIPSLTVSFESATTWRDVLLNNQPPCIFTKRTRTIEPTAQRIKDSGYG